MYAHRNEDIVNCGPATQGKKELSMQQNNGIMQSFRPTVNKRQSDLVREENALSSKERKKSQYSLLARFMNMGEVEFSKWLLSATPAEREKVLQDYKRKKKKSDG